MIVSHSYCVQTFCYSRRLPLRYFNSIAETACYQNSGQIGSQSWYVIVSFSFSYKSFAICTYFFSFSFNSNDGQSACRDNSGQIGSLSWYVIASFSFTNNPFAIGAYLFSFSFNSNGQSACSRTNSGGEIGNGSWYVLLLCSAITPFCEHHCY